MAEGIFIFLCHSIYKNQIPLLHISNKKLRPGFKNSPCFLQEKALIFNAATITKPILGAGMKTLTASKKKKVAARPRLDNSKADALLKARLFMNAEAAQRQARSMWLAVDPELRLEAAIELFRSDEVTLERAAEIAGLNRWVFHEILIKRDIKIVIEVDPVEELEKGVKAILKHSE